MLVSLVYVPLWLKIKLFAKGTRLGQMARPMDYAATLKHESDQDEV